MKSFYNGSYWVVGTSISLYYVKPIERDEYSIFRVLSPDDDTLWLANVACLGIAFDYIRSYEDTIKE